jgi:hypothetical protein
MKMRFLKSYINILGILLLGVSANAQTTTSSPYSVYGIGEIRLPGYGSSRAMGSTGIGYSSSSELNPINPASYNSIDSLAFIFETGIESHFSKYSLGDDSQKGHHTNFSYLALGFRYTPWWANSIGIAPYSSVGNKLTVTNTIDGTSDYATTSIEGTGGLNQFYWNNSFKLAKSLSVGVNISGIFGNITQAQKTTSSYYQGTLTKEDNIYVSQFIANFGFQYRAKLANKNKLTIGGIFSPKYSVKQNHTLYYYDQNSRVLDQSEDNSDNSIFYLPLTCGLGGSFQNDNLTILADFSWQDWSANESNVADVKYGKSSSLSLGVEYLPYKSFRDPYYKKIKYRIGAYNRNSYLLIKNHQLYDRGITAGLGIPIFKQRIHIDLSYEAGFKNGKGKGIISEKYQGVYFNLIMTDFWFVKPQYD